MGLGAEVDALRDSIPEKADLDVLREGRRGGLVFTTVDKVVAWARASSVFPLTFGIACCAIEMMTMACSRYDQDRYGIVFRGSPRQSDLMIVAGTVTPKMAERLMRLYMQMASPKYVIAMGSCAISGGPFHEGYNVIKGVDRLVPVDVYVPGCPPRPEALFNGFIELRAKIQS